MRFGCKDYEYNLLSGRTLVADEDDASTTIWYAVMRDHEDTDWGTGSYSLHEAKCKARNLRASGCGDAHIAVIEESKYDKVAIDLIYDLD